MLQQTVRELMVLADMGKNHQAAVTIPPGKIIEVLGPATDDRFVTIRVDGNTFDVFLTDLSERCCPVKEPQADVSGAGRKHQTKARGS
jgi:hypothetical protein